MSATFGIEVQSVRPGIAWENVAPPYIRREGGAQIVVSHPSLPGLELSAVRGRPGETWTVFEIDGSQHTLSGDNTTEEIIANLKSRLRRSILDAAESVRHGA
jgi:hypothetical protein